MNIRFYNTLTKKKEEFIPLNKKEVKIYVCGPTVNDIPHLGHARQQVTFDILRKYLEFLGYKVKFVSNITDIDDKIIKKAKELNEDIGSLTTRNFKLHLDNYSKIGIKKPTIQPKATEYIPQMINLIQILEKKGFTYTISGDGVYYITSKFKKYGKLSNQKISNLKSSGRIKENKLKSDSKDFVLWKFSKPSEPKWSSPWGYGRPGWHVECSAMSEHILGLPLDIHGGGQDLIFPHHEDEIAQSEIAFDKKLANFWIHNGLVNVDKIKMSKSLGNYKTIQDLLKDFSGEVIRYFILTTHYRSPIDFSYESLNKVKKAYFKLKDYTLSLKDDNTENNFYLDKFKKAMNNDLSTSEAVSVLWQFLKDSNAKGKFRTIKKIDSVFCLNLFKRDNFIVPNNIINLLNSRNSARLEKNWEKADKIRKKIESKGYKIIDKKNKSIVEKLNI